MLSNTERDHLSGKYVPNSVHIQVPVHRIRKKINTFLMLELPLMKSSGITEFSNNVTENSNAVDFSLENWMRSAGIEPATFSLGS